MSRQEREACVDAFAVLMKAKLAKNAHKGDRDGWRCDTPNALLRRLREEVQELAHLVDVPFVNDDGTDPDFAAEVGGEAADIANFAMVIADVAGAIDVRGLPDTKPLAEYERERINDGALVLGRAKPSALVPDVDGGDVKPRGGT